MTYEPAQEGRGDGGAAGPGAGRTKYFFSCLFSVLFSFGGREGIDGWEHEMGKIMLLLAAVGHSRIIHKISQTHIMENK